MPHELRDDTWPARWQQLERAGRRFIAVMDSDGPRADADGEFIARCDDVTIRPLTLRELYLAFGARPSSAGSSTPNAARRQEATV